MDSSCFISQFPTVVLLIFSHPRVLLLTYAFPNNSSFTSSYPRNTAPFTFLFKVFLSLFLFLFLFISLSQIPIFSAENIWPSKFSMINHLSQKSQKSFYEVSSHDFPPRCIISWYLKCSSNSNLVARNIADITNNGDRRHHTVVKSNVRTAQKTNYRVFCRWS